MSIFVETYLYIFCLYLLSYKKKTVKIKQFLENLQLQSTIIFVLYFITEEVLGHFLLRYRCQVRSSINWLALGSKDEIMI